MSTFFIINEIHENNFILGDDQDDLPMSEYKNELSFYDQDKNGIVFEDSLDLNNNIVKMEDNEEGFNLYDEKKSIGVEELKPEKSKYFINWGKNNSFIENESVQSISVDVDKQEKIIENQKEGGEKSKNTLEKNKVKKVYFNTINQRIIRKEIKKILNEKKTKKLFFSGNPLIMGRRKFKPDDIRKKIKSNFLKWVKNIINKKLICANSQKLFDYFPQCFVADINKKRNKEIINMSFKELVNTDFYNKYKNNKNKKDEDKRNEAKTKHEKKYLKNIEVMKYLEHNEDIRKKINFDDFEKRTFKELFNEYLESKGFDDHICKLKLNESQEYFKNYIIIAFNFINHYSK